jgi:hypothetical protein
MDKTIRKITDPVAQQKETYRYWRSQSPSERFRATYELSVEMYRAWMGQEALDHAQRSARTFVRVKRNRIESSGETENPTP